MVTNQKLPHWALERLAVQGHGSMGRAIQPFATRQDGDVLYAVTTDEVDNPTLSPARLGLVASELAWDAVLSSVPELPQPPSRTQIELSVDARRELEERLCSQAEGHLRSLPRLVGWLRDCQAGPRSTLMRGGFMHSFQYARTGQEFTAARTAMTIRCPSRLARKRQPTDEQWSRRAMADLREHTAADHAAERPLVRLA